MSTFQAKVRVALLSAFAALAATQITACGGASAAAEAPPLPPQATVNTGPADANFWERLGRVPAGAQRGDIYHVRERSDAPAGSKGFNIIYVSEGVSGALEYVSRMVFFPTAASATPTRRVMLWNHETVGSHDACAPSRSYLKWGSSWERIRGLSEYLNAGYVVAASDYQGLGTPGPTVYMQGKPQAKASLDIVLAAQRLPGTNAGSRVITGGWSQGGQTTLWVQNLAAAYAPNLDIVAGILHAPAARTLELVEYEASNTAYGAYYMAIHMGMMAGNPHLKLRDVIQPEGLEYIPYLAADCFGMWDAVERDKPVVARLEGLAPGMPWRVAHEANEAFFPQPSKPMLIVQGIADPDVTQDMSRRLEADLCAAGVPTQLKEIPGGHSAPVRLPIAPEIAWVEDRFAGRTLAQNCTGPTALPL